MREFLKQKLKLFLLAAAVLCGCIVALIGYSHYLNSQVHEIEMGYSDSEYAFDFGKTKKWPESRRGFFYGIQYDGFIENKTSSVLQDWEIQINLPTECELDSYWNGEFVLEDGILTITPVDYNETVDAYEVQPVGFVLLTKVENNLNSCKFIYHKRVHFYELPLFFPVLLLAVILLIGFIAELITAIRTEKLMKKQAEQRHIINQSFLTFANMIDAKDSYTKGHSQRVAMYSRELAKRLGYDEEEQERIFYIALLHDIGKIGVTDAILKKTAKLTYDEFNEVKEHVSMGGDILANFDAIDGIEDGARYHHERFDGTGYMEGLAGEEIPIVARIIGVADAFDAMSSARCYREALSKEEYIDELIKYSGKQFDPVVVERMLDMINCGFAPISKDFSLEEALNKSDE